MLNKKRNKGIPAGVFMSSGFNNHAMAEPFGEILDSWRKAVVPQSEPKPYEAKGRCRLMATAKLAVAAARSKTPANLQSCFKATIEEFDGGYDWDWVWDDRYDWDVEKIKGTIAIGGWMR
jgi:hypothetical protein